MRPTMVSARRCSLLRGARRPYLRDNLGLFLDGVRCDSAVEDTGVESTEGIAYAVVTTRSMSGPSRRRIHLPYGVFSDSESVVDDHTNIVDYDLDGETGQFVFDSGHRQLSIGQSGLLSSSARFPTMGVEHIAGGRRPRALRGGSPARRARVCAAS